MAGKELTDPEMLHFIEQLGKNSSEAGKMLADGKLSKGEALRLINSDKSFENNVETVTTADLHRYTIYDKPPLSPRQFSNLADYISKITGQEISNQIDVKGHEELAHLGFILSSSFDGYEYLVFPPQYNSTGQSPNGFLTKSVKLSVEPRQAGYFTSIAISKEDDGTRVKLVSNFGETFACKITNDSLIYRIERNDGSVQIGEKSASDI